MGRGYYSYDGFGADAVADDTKVPLTEAQRAQVAAMVASKVPARLAGVAAKATMWSFGMLDIAADAFAKTQAGRITRHTGDTLTSALAFYDDVKAKKYKTTPSGMASYVKGAEAVVSGLTSALTAAGVSDAITSEISGWTAVAGTCAVGVTVPGWGWAACGLSMLAKVLATALSGPRVFVYSWDTPRSTFKTDNESTRMMTITDGITLARMLAWHYKTSFEDLEAPLSTSGDIEEFRWITQGYPKRPSVSNGQFGPAGPIPAHNLRTLLQMASALAGYSGPGAVVNVRSCLQLLAGYRSGKEPTGRGLYERYDKDQDINATTIANGAYFGRCAVGTYGRPITSGVIVDGGDIKGSGASSGQDYLSSLDWTPFVIVDEWINFFAGLSAVEQRRGLDPAGERAYRVGGYSPIDMLTVCNFDHDGMPDNGAPPQCAQREQAVCWTNLKLGRDSAARFFDDCVELRSGVRSSNEEALREFGALRLMAAFSMLQLQRMWSGDLRAERIDPVTEVDVSGPIEVEAPVDPRQMVYSNGAWNLREDVPSSSVQYFDGGGNRRNQGRVYPLNASAFKCVPAVNENNRGGFAYSQVGPTYLANTIEEHDAAVRAAAEAAFAAAGMTTSGAVQQNLTGAALLQALRTGVQSRMNVGAQYATRSAGERAFVVTPTAVSKFKTGQAALLAKQQAAAAAAQQAAAAAQSGGSSTLIIGAAALAALLLFKR